MTDQLLRETLTRMADRVEPAAPDPTVWGRAHRSRRRADVVVAAVGLAVFALVAAVGLLGARDPSRPEPAPVVPGPPGIPSVVRGVEGDGGLEFESDLAVGRASVAVVNPTGVVVVTAADGEYHRLSLPGFDPAVYDDPQVRDTGMVGVRLSPDGSRLAYGWHVDLPGGAGRPADLMPSGVRILSLVDGHIETLDDLGPMPPEFEFSQRNEGFRYAVVPFGFRWSSDGRYLAYEHVWVEATALTEAYDLARSNSSASVYDSDRRERFGVNEFGQGLGWTGWPQMVSGNGLVGTGGFVYAERNTRRRVRVLPGEGWTSGLFASGGRAFLEQVAVPRLAEVTLRTGAVRLLRLDTGSPVDLLGWIGPDRALAVAGTDLVVLDVADEAVASTVVGQIVVGATGSTFSFATDWATPQHPTRDFAEGPARSASTPDPAAPSSGLDRDWLLAGLGAGVLAAVLVALALRRRLRPS